MYAGVGDTVSGTWKGSASVPFGDMIPYETRVFDTEGMLPEVAGEDEPGAMMEEVGLETDQEEVREEGAGVVGSAESGELKAKTHENHHPHPTRRLERRKGLRETSLR